MPSRRKATLMIKSTGNPMLVRDGQAGARTAAHAGQAADGVTALRWRRWFSLT